MLKNNQILPIILIWIKTGQHKKNIFFVNSKVHTCMASLIDYSCKLICDQEKEHDKRGFSNTICKYTAKR